MVVTKGTRAAKGLLNLWSTDSSTFPVVFLVGIAMTAAIGNGARYLINNPDVCLDKSKRNNFIHYNENQGSDWRARRFRFANIKKNAINQSRQFDPAFEKEENKSVHRA
ncbi:Phosphatidylinositol 3 [Phytophthora cinnamomi]|uniref:Phosphatidylinositol 3 n=1 Tax=Phytophthora cinnamomi TaxID=4785 RepID=UPI00355A637F|nr:Phosphatidylinositol 3 [Phytophthora cinnamomi]